MTRARKLLITGAAVLVLGAGGAGIAQAVSGDEGPGDREESGEQDAREEQAVGGSAASRAAAAAVKAIGGGTATEVEQDGSGYEVEVKRSDGRYADVKLDSSLKAVTTGGE